MPVEVGFRISDWDTPLRVNPHRTPGRFHRVGSPATQYISLHPLGPWAEYLRYHDLRQLDETLDLRLTLWALRPELGEALLLDFEEADRNPELAELGFSPEDLVSDDYSACQALADRLRADASAPKALIVPNAALPGTRNLVIFGPRIEIPYLWQPLDATDIPACAITTASRPPAKLLERVRFSGSLHAELAAWRGGRRLAFADLH